ncbi:MAG: aminoacyl-tRNA hydrolase [Bacillati bacterium ANGP1]|uniref:Peptidyl-tRNA hydrolase n=1 Tax=Candidatus Segetimicrobium genomatis TaxID=2569760 RepID=A0A537L785_9BACT|nr:MAG: aminoacyl-tRNA hydrolase [Terrabacteria group bacterium ANGP1]
MKLIIGLGNPDRRYRHTRHNVGWEVIDRVGRRLGIAVDQDDGWATVGAGTVGRRRVLLAKPQTYVNLSGTAVADLRRRHRVKIEDLVVVVDDLDLPLGRLRLRPGGSHGGHNGLRSIIDALGSDAFPRLRVGIGRPPEGMDPAQFVLTPFTAEERATMDPALERAAEAIETVIREGLQAAMNRFNAKPAAVSR